MQSPLRQLVPGPAAVKKPGCTRWRSSWFTTSTATRPLASANCPITRSNAGQIVLPTWQPCSIVTFVIAPPPVANQRFPIDILSGIMDIPWTPPCGGLLSMDGLKADWRVASK